MRKFLFRTFITLAVSSSVIVFALYMFLLSYHGNTLYYFAPTTTGNLFSVQSIDTMKSSRDMSRQMLNNPNAFKPMVDKQMARIADAGATHVAIATPYDTEFLPVLRLWVASARSHHLSVWFRGNFSGWEGWFNYPKIDRTTHTQLLVIFLDDNTELFQSGDVFSPCPECENGGPGDPRQTGDVAGYNAFLREEKTIADNEFALQDKHIAVYPSMNADIARQIITPATVRAFGGTILIDHYVHTPEQFAGDIKAIPEQLKANVGLGEFGAPIPDLNGWMTQTEQANYIDSLFKAMYLERAHIPVVNYWTLSGGSTALLNDDGTPRAAYFTVQNYFKAFNLQGVIYDSLGESMGGVRVNVNGTNYATVSDGTYQIFVPRQHKEVTVQADGYDPVTLHMPTNATATLVKQDVHLKPINPDWWYRTRAYLYKKLQLKMQ